MIELAYSRTSGTSVATLDLPPLGSEPPPALPDSTLPLHCDGKDVKDSDGNVVVLKGINFPRFIDTANGDWQLANGGKIWDTWTPAVVQANLDVLQAWGCNVVRILSTIEWWVADHDTHQQHIKDFCTWASARGIYVVYGFWRCSGAGTQCGVPYLPWCENNVYCETEAEFVTLWADVATELQTYDNVLFEFWNEPVPGDTEANWFVVVQDALDAIRATGATNICIPQWGYCFGVDLNNPPPAGWMQGMEFVEDDPLVDATGNLLYSIHCYRDSLTDGGTQIHSYADIDEAFDYCLLSYTLDTLDKPVWIGEIGPNQWNLGDLVNEYDFYDNALSRLNDLGVGFAAWWFWETGNAWGHYVSGQPNWDPSSAGIMLKAHL